MGSLMIVVVSQWTSPAKVEGLSDSFESCRRIRWADKRDVYLRMSSNGRRFI